jgi:hypothetical protein
MEWPVGGVLGCPVCIDLVLLCSVPRQLGRSGECVPRFRLPVSFSQDSELIEEQRRA